MASASSIPRPTAVTYGDLLRRSFERHLVAIFHELAHDEYLGGGEYLGAAASPAGTAPAGVSARWRTLEAWLDATDPRRPEAAPLASQQVTPELYRVEKLRDDERSDPRRTLAAWMRAFPGLLLNDERAIRVVEDCESAWGVERGFSVAAYRRARSAPGQSGELGPAAGIALDAFASELRRLGNARPVAYRRRARRIVTPAHPEAPRRPRSATSVGHTPHHGHPAHEHPGHTRPAIDHTPDLGRRQAQMAINSFHSRG